MIAHLDLDAFYASVALLDHPELRGKPLVVAFSGRRSVVLTASYEARPFKIRSAIPLYRALELCPQLIVVPPEMARYKTLSAQVFAILRADGYPVEGLSLDEAFIDLGEMPYVDACIYTNRLRDLIAQQTRLTASAGVGSSKVVAKIASEMNKPNGICCVPPGEEAEFLAPLSVGQLWGIGPKTKARLEQAAILTIGDLARLDPHTADVLLGSSASFFANLARGIDERQVQPERETKSISTEETFEYDVDNERVLLRTLRLQAEELAQTLEREHLWAGTVGVKLKLADFTVRGRQVSLREPVADARRIYAAARWCLRRSDHGDAAVRLLGTRVANFIEEQPAQLSFSDMIERPNGIT